MEPSSVSLEQVVKLTKLLSPIEKVRLIERVMPDLEASLAVLNVPQAPLRSSYGICSDLGSAPLSEEIEEVRHEMLKNFPRDDI